MVSQRSLAVCLCQNAVKDCQQVPFFSFLSIIDSRVLLFSVLFLAILTAPFQESTKVINLHSLYIENIFLRTCVTLMLTFSHITLLIFLNSIFFCATYFLCHIFYAIYFGGYKFGTTLIPIYAQISMIFSHNSHSGNLTSSHCTTHTRETWITLQITFLWSLPTPTPLMYSTFHALFSTACLTPPSSLSVIFPTCHFWATCGLSYSFTELSVSVSLGGPAQITSWRGSCGLQGNTEPANHLDLTRHIYVLTRHSLKVTFQPTISV